jgi:hypothetical protein
MGEQLAPGMVFRHGSGRVSSVNVTFSMQPLVAVFSPFTMAIGINHQQNEKNHPTNRQDDDNGLVTPKF